MLIIPAIDLKDGCVVRLTQGRLKDKKIYSRDAIKVAKHWLRQGAQLIHVVDLDGATTGIPKNLEIVKQIAAQTRAALEFGGGVRKIETIKALLDAGVSRVVLGTKAIEDSTFLKEAFKKFKNKVIVSIDARDGQVLVKGWQEKSTKLEAVSLAKQLKALGFKEVIYTDISKDGMLKGPNIKGIKALLKESRLKVVASGGISSLEDIMKLKLLEKDGVSGIIIGKALYEGKFTLTQALRI
ncbi:MAG: 1-(5-phosphoribosyl)-5-[(5-phosphoribosylamino)methylideneamino]imidazole-4-carboxamide isomerase [Candidatus Omnitrophota bacterium]